MQTVKWALCASLTLVGCASTSVTGGSATRTDGLGADLRVFLDDTCLPPELDSAGAIGPFGFGATTLGEIAVGAGEIAFQSFGRFLEEAGQPNVHTSTGITSALFYSGNPSDIGFGDLNRNIQCVHVVRGGFEPGNANFDDSVPYAHLGLTSKPSLYAAMRLEPTGDRSAFFRGDLLHVEANSFEHPGGERTRDIAITFDFGSPLDGPGISFASSVLQLPGIEIGREMGEIETNGLVTVWMGTPPRADNTEQLAFNLQVSVVESKRGNPFLADIGRLLQSEPVVASVSQDIAEVVTGDRTRQRREADFEFAQRADERALRRNLEDAVQKLEDILEDEFSDDRARVYAIRETEDIIATVERQQAAEGWISRPVTPLIRRAEALIRNVSSQIGQEPNEDDDDF